MTDAALKNSEQRVQPLNSGTAVAPAGVGAGNWDDIRLFLEVANNGSLRAAAERLNVSVNTVRARVARLEEARGTTMLRRTSRGVALTGAGRQLAELAANLGMARLGAGGGPADDVLVKPGQVTIACTEGLGTGWLTPRIGELQSRIPELSISLQYDFDLQRDRSHWADVGLSYHPPANPDLIVAKVATIHFMLFASPDYLRRNGEPKTMDDLIGHSFVEQSTTGYNSSMIDLLIGADRAREAVRISTNSALTQAWAAANGAGIALLPSYTRAITSTVVPLALVPHMRFPVSFFYHANAKGSPAVRAVIDWMRDSFDPVRFPWFAEHFVHPDNFPREERENGVVTLYEHLADRISRKGQ
jgi:DNA-binding transcriptional LysR family regulator